MSQLLEVRNLEKVYPLNSGIFQKRTARALFPVSFSLNPGETLAVVGETGSGKSTLAKLLAGADAPSSGEIYLNGHQIVGHNSRYQSRNIRLIFQDPKKSLNPNMKIGHCLAAPLTLLSKMSSYESKEKIRSILSKVGLLPEHAEYYPHMFSGGQLQRVALARAMIVDPRILVLDEAVAALDPSIRAQIINLLLQLQEESKVSYILITHHLSLVRHISDFTMVLQNGRAVEYARTEKLFDRPNSDYTKRLLLSQSL